MPKNLKLKEALNRHKGVDHKLERQKKLQKEAEKKKRAKKGSSVEVEELEAEAEEDEDNAAKKLATSPAERKREKKSANKAEQAQQANGEADGWETDDSEDGEENEAGVEVGAMEDESDSDSEEEFMNGNAGEEDEDEEDIPLSDIESLASEDRGDIIPHQRLTINNTAALQRSLKAFALPSSLPFSATQSVTSAEPVQIADVEDDLNRELAFYRQSLDAVTEARAKLKKEGVPFTRPTDYFAEMVKSEEQMGKVRSKLLDETARKKASADARRQRDLKKFGKAVQVAKLQERQKEKTQTLERIQTLKRKRQGADLTANEDDTFDVAVEDAETTAKNDRATRRAKGAADGEKGRKRQKKDEKHGFGGKKKYAKSNDAKSTSDLSGFPGKRMKGGGKARPGKSKRART